MRSIVDFSGLIKILTKFILFMKKTAFILLSAFTLTGFYACNGGGETKDETKTGSSIDKPDSTKDAAKMIATCTGITNLLITDDSAHKMMERFDSIYKKLKTAKPLNYLSNSHWIDAMIINSYANFFESNAGKDFDGVSFVNGADNNNTKSRILMVPTKPSTVETKKHENIWGKNIVPLETGDPVEYLDFETSGNIATTLQDNYNHIYRTVRGLPRDKDPLSEAVWMSRCVFIYMRDKIKDEANQIDGIRIYMGAYGKMTGTVPGQIDPYQSTILLVPTTKGGDKVHNDSWDILRQKAPIKIDDALNHGELCPQVCN